MGWDTKRNHGEEKLVKENDNSIDNNNNNNGNGNGDGLEHLKIVETKSMLSEMQRRESEKKIEKGKESTCRLDFLLALVVFFGNLGQVYFIVSIFFSGVTLLNYTANSSLFFCSSTFCSWSGPLAPLLRCCMSLPPFGLIYTLL
ncbi:hypothetical protein RFI_19843, partial [Reticulomyxa filosa]